MYKLTPQGNSIIRLADGACIPTDPNNSDYQVYLKFVQDGGTPTPADPLTPIPLTCSPWQMRWALNQTGLRQPVEDMIAASGNIVLKDGWEFATEFREVDPFVIGLGHALGKTPAELHELFELALSM